MNHAREPSVDQSTGEVFPSQDRFRAAPSGEGVTRLQELLSDALERNARTDQRLADAYAEIERLRVQAANLSATVSEKRQNFHNKLAEAQGRFRAITATSSAAYETKKGKAVQIDYANLGAMLESIRPVFSELGLSCRQPVLDHPEDGRMTVVQTVLACDGYEEVVSSLSFVNSSKTGGDFKELGTAITYARRYTLAASLGLAIDVPKEPHRETVSRPNSRQADAPGAQASHDEIEYKLKTLSFAEVVQVFNALDNETKRRYKTLFDERRNQHQSQARRAA